MSTLNKYPEFPMNDHANIVRIIKELKEVIQRESKRHMMDTHLDSTLHDLIAYEIIPVLEEQLDYEPSDEDLGYGSEPSMTADEMHSVAWKEHQEAHR
jgi:acyl carrier protein